MEKIKIFLWLLIYLASIKSLHAQNHSIPSYTIPNGLGVNIHFTNPKPGEMQMLSEAGFHWVRMDFFWSEIEKEKGEYDFLAYDRLWDSLNKYHLKAIFILDYGNRLYDNGLSPHSPEAIKAFASWAAASVHHFAGKGILWEMWNEPNIGFWKPKPDVNAYIKLALATGKAIKKAAPKEAFIGPASSTIPLGFLTACFKAGLLTYWDAVSLHPYRQGNPESVVADYKSVRKLIAQYAPKGKSIPIISSEWGYSSAWKNFTPEKQGIMLAREFLTNVSDHIPLSIWYDWHDDGTNLNDPEHHFGTVAHPYYPGRYPVYDPKPAWLAAKTLTHTLKGFHFDKRISIGNPDDYVLSFQKGRHIRLAAWTTQQPHNVELPVRKGKYEIYHYNGKFVVKIKSDKKGIRIKLTDAPQYFIPVK